MITRFMNIYCQPRKLLLCSLIVVLVGCATKSNYRDAQSLPPLKVPENLDKDTLGQLYSLPDDAVAKHALSPVINTPLPPGLNAHTRLVATKASVQALESQFWMTVPSPPAQAWSQLIRVLQALKQPIIKQDIASATIDTGWSAMGAAAQLAHRYQIQLQSGLQPEITEIHLVNKQAQAEAIFNNIALASQTTQWPLESDNKTHERWFLGELTKALNAAVSNGGDSLLASRISLPAKVVLGSDVGEPVLEFATSRARAYAAISQSLTQGAIQLYEQDAEQGVFYIPDGSATASNRARYELKQILSALPDEVAVNRLFVGERNTKTIPGLVGYLVVLHPFAEQYRVYVRDAYGRVLPEDKARELLNVIQQELL